MSIKFLRLLQILPVCQQSKGDKKEADPLIPGLSQQRSGSSGGGARANSAWGGGCIENSSQDTNEAPLQLEEEQKQKPATFPGGAGNLLGPRILRQYQAEVSEYCDPQTWAEFGCHKEEGQGC